MTGCCHVFRLELPAKPRDPSSAWQYHAWRSSPMGEVIM